MDRVGQLIDDARKDARMKWAELARAADIDPQTLRRYRNGERRTDDTTRAIEIVFGWPRGYLDAVAAGEEPPLVEPAVLVTPSALEPPDQVRELEALSEIAISLEQQVAELRRRIAGVIHDEQQQRRA